MNPPKETETKEKILKFFENLNLLQNILKCLKNSYYNQVIIEMFTEKNIIRIYLILLILQR